MTAVVLGFHVPNQELGLDGAAVLFVCQHWEPAMFRSGYFCVNERLDGKSHKMLLIETLRSLLGVYAMSVAYYPNEIRCS